MTKMLYELVDAAHGFDIRELIERFEELAAERLALVAALDEAREERASNPAGEESALDSVITEREAELTAWDDDDGEEFAKLKDFLESVVSKGGDHEWRGAWYPVTFIKESNFEDYAEEYASDIHGGAVDDARWPFDHIDWKAAAAALRQDFSEAELEGETYLFR